MSISAIDWPSGILPSTLDWKLKSNSGTFTSPWTNQTQSVRYPGSAWTCKMTLADLDDYESRELEVLLVSLDGYSGRVKLTDWGRAPAVVLGSPVVSGAGQTGRVLRTSGWNPSVTVLKKGDYITVNDELKLILADAVSDSTGFANLQIGPQLRNIPSNASAIEVARPYGIFRLSETENGASRKPGFANDFDLQFVEAFF